MVPSLNDPSHCSLYHNLHQTGQLDQVTIEPIKLWSQSLPIGNVDLGVVVVEVDLGVVVFF